MVDTSDRIAVEVAMKEHAAMQLMADGTDGIADHCIIHVTPVRKERNAPAHLGVKSARSIDQLEGTIKMIFADQHSMLSFVLGEMRRLNGVTTNMDWDVPMHPGHGCTIPILPFVPMPTAPPAPPAGPTLPTPLAPPAGVAPAAPQELFPE